MLIKLIFCLPWRIRNQNVRENRFSNILSVSPQGFHFRNTGILLFFSPYISPTLQTNLAWAPTGVVLVNKNALTGKPKSPVQVHLLL